jgi:hypothetical protein
MSTPLQPQYAPFQSQPQTPEPKKRFNWALALTVFVAVLIGAGLGFVSKPDPAPVVQVQEKEVEVEKEVTPAACGTALDLGSEIIGNGGTVIGLLSDSLEAVADFDAATIRANNVKVKEQTEKLKEITPEFLTSRETCRASLK